MMIVLRVLLIIFYYRSLGGVLICLLDVLVQVSIHNPRPSLVSSGKRSGKRSGRAYLTPPSKEKEKRNPLYFKEIPQYEIFSKKTVLSRKISLSLIYRLCQCISCWSN